MTQFTSKTNLRSTQGRQVARGGDIHNPGSNSMFDHSNVLLVQVIFERVWVVETQTKYKVSKKIWNCVNLLLSGDEFVICFVARDY